MQAYIHLSESKSGQKIGTSYHAEVQRMTDHTLSVNDATSMPASPAAAAGQSSMVVGSTEQHMRAGNGLVVNRARGGQVLRGRFERSDGQDSGVHGGGQRQQADGWGVVRLLREGEKSPTPSSSAVGTAGSSRSSTTEDHPSTVRDEALTHSPVDRTILCIPAVPAYMAPSDFLDFVGNKTREVVTHFRMIITEHVGRYMVLMKFRVAEDATAWRAEFDGKVFNGVEVCVFFCNVFPCLACLLFSGCGSGSGVCGYLFCITS